MFNSSTKTGEKTDEKKLQVLVTELTKNLKTPEDLSQLAHILKKLIVETTLRPNWLRIGP
ncbi:protein of unknown function [Xenorhabdus poinarii G6]|uniref:Uncharacterized protein n=1 Tax=Xenorhabdus poinarii G6 TaxID=1354304 RepID=A0A068R571_9GAMM|nr:hypothetical protein [Xenorhabdus poinarii]CDG22348.1 protein of unknown function [Xenorhabdus poinarii G6]